jgi:predicted dehydrogenase
VDEICKTDIDALVIITQPWLHARQAIQAMESEKHVYTAVPAARSLEECDQLVEAVKRTGMIYMNGETSYFRPETAFCRKKAAEGAFGEFVYCHRNFPKPPFVTRIWQKLSALFS